MLCASTKLPNPVTEASAGISSGVLRLYTGSVTTARAPRVIHGVPLACRLVTKSVHERQRLSSLPLIDGFVTSLTDAHGPDHSMSSESIGVRLPFLESPYGYSILGGKLEVQLNEHVICGSSH